MFRRPRPAVLFGLFAVALSFLCALRVPGPADAQAPITLKLATIVGVEHPFST